jgi:hypothetical protein
LVFANFSQFKYDNLRRFYYFYLINFIISDAAEDESILVKNLTKVYWATQTIAIVSSIAVSVVFWVGVYNPGESHSSIPYL